MPILGLYLNPDYLSPLLRRLFFRVSIQCCHTSGLLILFGFWNFSWYASFNMVNWLDLIFINLVTLTFWTFSVVSKQCADTAAAVLHLKTHEFSMHEHLIRPTTKYTESLPLCLAYSFVFGFGSPRPHRLWKFSVFSVWVKAQWEDKMFWGSIFLFWLFFDIANSLWCC